MSVESLFRNASRWWRPVTGWICACGIAVEYVIRPVAQLILHTLGKPITLPSIDAASLWTLTSTTLGLAGARTAEKLSGVTAPAPTEEVAP